MAATESRISDPPFAVVVSNKLRYNSPPAKDIMWLDPDNLNKREITGINNTMWYSLSYP